MNEHYFDNNTHIGGWYMPVELCDKIINYFNSMKSSAVEGKSNYNQQKGVHKQVKDSLDLDIKPDYNFEPFGEYRHYLQNCLMKYIEKYPDCNDNLPFNLLTPYNIQYYPISGGFKKWHFENAGNNKRILVFMTYLNDVDDGGTEFKIQNLTTPAKKGLTVIWPAHWTHTHRGQISNTKEKYIITGWYDFKK